MKNTRGRAGLLYISRGATCTSQQFPNATADDPSLECDKHNRNRLEGWCSRPSGRITSPYQRLNAHLASEIATRCVSSDYNLFALRGLVIFSQSYASRKHCAPASLAFQFKHDIFVRGHFNHQRTRRQVTINFWQGS